MSLPLYIIVSLIVFVLSIQVSVNDIKLLSGKYNHKINITNYIAWIGLIFIIFAGVNDIRTAGVLIWVAALLFALVLAFIWQFVLSRANLKFRGAFLLQLVPVVLTLLVLYNNYHLLTPFFVYGFYYRNNAFGAPNRKDWLFFHKPLSHNVKVAEADEVPNSFIQQLPDFRFAGNDNAVQTLTRYNVTDHNIYPNTSEDVLPKVQALIDKAGKSGGGEIYFPKGRYLFNKNGSGFIQINYSNICLRGEIDSDGQPVAELVNCSQTAKGKKNPWLSPFFITAGEDIQPSNIFFGVQFKNKKDIITRSGSLSDPGSDGTIITPPKAANITEFSPKGSKFIKVDNVESLRPGDFIIIALFNNRDGALIKDILGFDELRPEWGNALRAGEETAPSYQDLVEIDDIDIQNLKIKLKRPLRRDIDTTFNPGVFKVDMLKNVSITDLVISSKWNGLFRHHGFPYYYSVRQSQEMDYGWNGINLKRVAYGYIGNVVLKNHTLPLYVLDSCKSTVENIVICGHDGHQGLKIYEHSNDNLFRNIEFWSEYADMMGGEGNAYGNVFSNIRYVNPYFNPVSFDFHGFSEGPMSPPAQNLFEGIYGFSHIKGAGALFNQPAYAKGNVWWNIISDGEIKGDNLVIHLTYIPKTMFNRVVFTSVGVLRTVLSKKIFSPRAIVREFKTRFMQYNAEQVSLSEHYKLFPENTLVGYNTTSRLPEYSNKNAYNNKGLVSPISLYDYQKSKA